MFPFDEDDEGDVSFGESSDAEREMTPDIPKAPSVKTFDDDGDFGSASDVDSQTLRAFVAAVIYANVAVLFVALGPMVWYFEGWSRAGPALFVVGLLAGIRTYQTYRSWDRSRTEAGDSVPTAGGDDIDAESASDDDSDVSDGPDGSDGSDGPDDSDGSDGPDASESNPSEV